MTDVSPQLWSDISQQLSKRVGRDVVDRWFADGVIELLSEEQMNVRFPDPFRVTWLETYYRSDLEEVVAKNLGSPIKVQLTSPEMNDLAPEPLDTDATPVVTEDDLARFRQSVETTPTGKVKAAGLNPKFTFASFVVGDNSQYCHATATAVAQNPGSQYNPVLFYGGTGLGKTHLMTAIGHEVLEKHPKKKVLFVTAEQFTNEFIDAVQASKLAEFRAKYRSVDVLLIDDIHFVAGKDATQEEFFHTFNALINSHSQLVMTSDRPPGDVPRLEKRLVSRFQWGIAAEIMAPNVETRIAILRQKAHEWKIELDSPVLEFIAAKIGKNVRRLEGALLRISSYVSLYKGRVSVEQAEDYLRDILMEEASSGMVTVSNVQKEVASYYDVRLADLSGRSRTATIVQPRQMAMYLSRELTHASLKEIGQAFGGRDHGTVIHACKKVNEDIESSPEMKRIADFLKDKLTQ